MIDTGATVSCFDLAAAKQAGLPNAGVAYTNSATHKNQKVPTFSGTIICPNINIDINEAMGLPLSGLTSQNSQKGNLELIALIGRDFLSTAVLIYNGPNGNFSIAF